MIKNALATAAVATAIAAVAAPQAAANDHGSGTDTVNGNGSKQIYGNSATHGNMSPQMALIQGSLNKPCIGLPLKGNVGSLVGLVPVTVQDINVLSSPQNQQCVENSTQSKGDEALSHLVEDLPIISKNGTANH
ncbi:rodlin [Streptomyces boncukensis]|uniref:RdlA protein n=1 Tax=Streptomyces boncukensis TaxID=2711219 RepID=A0A6G4WZ67_9ACTN|nr:rodlin [Streptomyces boncukensis]NGO69814.1 RdlA protein [Streptomyces boncukensis]